MVSRRATQTRSTLGVRFGFGTPTKTTQATPQPVRSPILAVTRPVLPPPTTRLPIRPRPKTRQTLGSRQPAKPFIKSQRQRPKEPVRAVTRVQVSSPSGSGRPLTVSSRSRLASDRPKRKLTTSKNKARLTEAVARGRKRLSKTQGKGLRKLPRPDRPRPIPQREFGSDFNIFKVVGDRTFVSSTRTGKTGKQRSVGVPQRQQSIFASFLGEPTRPRGRPSAKGGAGRPTATPRPPLRDNTFVTSLFEVPLFFPRQLAKSDSPLRQGLELTPIGQASKLVSERVSKKPLPQEERAFGSDFNILNFFG